MPHPFVPVDRIADPTISFAWDDWDPYQVVGNPPADRVETLGLIADRALVAYAIACAEWVVYRFSRLSDDRIPYQFLEAAWVYEIDHRFDPPPESEEAEWKGSIRGPIDLALMTILNGIGSTDDGKAEADAALAEQIALHVVPLSGLFREWQAAAVKRLLNFFSRQGGSDDIPVPPAVFATDSAYDPARNSAYVEQFMATVDVAANPFLRGVRH